VDVLPLLRGTLRKGLAGAPPLPFDLDDVTYLYEYQAEGGEG
jgi:hypothetical protein